MSTKVPNIDNVFMQLDAALCLLARAKGETPPMQHFHESTSNMRLLLLDGGTFQVIVTRVEEEKK